MFQNQFFIFIKTVYVKEQKYKTIFVSSLNILSF